MLSTTACTSDWHLGVGIMRVQWTLAALWACHELPASCTAQDPSQTAEWATAMFQDQNGTTFPAESATVSEGAVPEWLRGTLARVGPGVWRLPHRSADHMFDGLAKVTKWDLDGATSAEFTHRFVESNVFQAAMENGAYPRGLAFGPFTPPFSLHETKVSNDNNNVNVWFADSGRLFALTDGPTVVELDADTLETIGHANFTGPLAGGDTSSAHGLPDVSPDSNGALLNFVTVVDDSVGKVNITVLRVGELKDDYTRDLNGFGTLQMSIAEWPYMHSFGRTESHMIITAYPAVLNTLEMGLGRPLTKCIHWQGADSDSDSDSDSQDASVPTRLAVFAIPKPGSEVRDTEPIAVVEDVPPFYSWHSVNAFDASDDSGTITLDVVAHPKFGPDIIADSAFTWFSNSLDPAKYNDTFAWTGTLKRIVIDPETKTSKVTDLPAVDAEGNVYYTEFPRVRDDRSGRDYCFVYATAFYAGNSTWFQDSAIVKVDVCKAAAVAADPHSTSTATATAWGKPGHFPGEPIFVARPNSSTEDDGIVLVSMLDGQANSSYLAILNATTMEQVARVDAPYPIPFALHGEWVPNHN